MIHDTGWLEGARRYPGESRFPTLKTLVKTTTRAERWGKASEKTRYYIASALLTAERAARSTRSHWGIEAMHSSLDETFREDLSRLRRGHGAMNMALVRRLAFSLVRRGNGKRSIKTARKAASWNTTILAEILSANTR